MHPPRHSLPLSQFLTNGGLLNKSDKVFVTPKKSTSSSQQALMVLLTKVRYRRDFFSPRHSLRCCAQQAFIAALSLIKDFLLYFLNLSAFVFVNKDFIAELLSEVFSFEEFSQRFCFSTWFSRFTGDASK